MPVNNTVKALTKKRKHQTSQPLLFTLSEINVRKRQSIWYSTFIISYVWFMYWIAQDFFVWHKPFSQVNPVNILGAIASIAFIWAGTKILKPNKTCKATSQQPLLPPLTQQPQQTQKPMQKPAPQLAPQATPQSTQESAPANSGCAHHLGYLNRREKSQDIPAECFTCANVIQCMSSKN
jgi:hypothetical protein